LIAAQGLEAATPPESAMPRLAAILLLCCTSFAWSAEPATAAPALAPAATAAPAKALSPAYQRIEIANARARVVVVTQRAAIERFELLDVHPVDLPTHLGRDDAAWGGPGKDGKPALAVLSNFYSRDRDAALPTTVNLHSLLLSDRSGSLVYGLDGAKDIAPWTVAEQAADRVTLRYDNRRGQTYEMVYVMDAQRPTVAARLTVRNGGGDTITLNPALVPINGIHQDYPAGEVSLVEVADHRGGASGTMTSYTVSPGFTQPLTGGADWLALRSRFFAAFWTPGRLAVEGGAPAPEVVQPVATGPGATGPVAAGPAAASGGWKADAKGYTVANQAFLNVTCDPQVLKPGTRLVQEWSLTATSLRKADLALLDASERGIEFTGSFYKFFRILTEALTWMLDLIVKLVVNYGVAVVILTLLIKAVLFKLTFKQHESMIKMQKLAPELKYLQEQYKDNKQMMAQKQMELWKKHGVNPLGGCLPILIQIPIFIALYQAFQYSADMRGSSFLWVHDLTLPDQIWGMPISFLGGWVLSLNPLPLIYIGVSAWMSFSMPMTTSTDPTQEQMAKMMRWMPIVFGVIFYNMPSGLVLYFTANAVLSTLEIKWIRRRLGVDAPKPAKA
jgi:YidC/Oxa1 family membrane protein insertase